MEERVVKVADLSIREDVQVRKIRHDAVNDYAEQMRAGTVFPPPDVFRSGSGYYPANGFHRVLAAQKAELEEMTVCVHEGGHREAILMAVGANAENGIRRTNTDKRRAVETLLKDDEWKSWSDGAIAQQCKVSQAFVSKVRREMIQNGAEFPSKKKGADGKTRDTTNIGKKGSGQTTSPSVGQVSEPNPPDDIGEILKTVAQIKSGASLEEIERLRARIAELEREVETKNQRIAELEQALAEAKPFWPLIVTGEGSAEARQ